VPRAFCTASSYFAVDFEMVAMHFAVSADAADAIIAITLAAPIAIRRV